MARNRWTNELGWEDDEERGPLVQILDELVRGTSSSDETCVWFEEFGRWLICFTYSRPPHHAVTRDWCTWADDPHPPPDDPPDPPPGWPVAWGDDMTLQVFGPLGGTAPCCHSGFHGGGVFDADLGIWGGFRITLSDDDCDDAIVEVYPVAWEGDQVTWQCRTLSTDPPPSILTAVSGTGVWPLFTALVGEWNACPESWVALITNPGF